MFSPSTIISMSARAASKAARAKTSPHVVYDERSALLDLRSAPFVGDCVARGWRPLDLDALSTETAAELERFRWAVVTVAQDRALQRAREQADEEAERAFEAVR